jgi:hypothetical protein
MSQKVFFFLSVALLALGAVGCQPHIGDKCVLNTDCSVTGTLQCDTSMPGGYCTIFNCGPNSCPDGNACYLFHAEVQGCPYSDRDPSRTAHSFCLEDCSKNSDCRYGYTCTDLRQPPWNAILLDDNQNQPACVPNKDTAFSEQGAAIATGTAAPVCQSYPDVDAAFPDEDAGEPFTPLDSGADATLGDAGAADASDADAG